MAAVLKRHTTELWEFRTNYLAKRMILLEKQNRQKSDSLKVLRRSGFYYRHQNPLSAAEGVTFHFQGWRSYSISKDF